MIHNEVVPVSSETECERRSMNALARCRGLRPELTRSFLLCFVDPCQLSRKKSRRSRTIIWTKYHKSCSGCRPERMH